MGWEQIFVFVLLIACLGLFAWGRWRYDVVAAISMVLLVLMDIVPAKIALQNFGHPAVITVAAVLVISRALRNAGIADTIANSLSRFTSNTTAHIGLLTLVTAFFSSFMNNVGALALMLPVAIATASKQNRSTAILLMPLAFGSILGGLVTLFGTPPNIIIANYRAGVVGEPFSMFDFAPVGFVIAIVGVIFISLIGWRFIPKDRQSSIAPDKLFAIKEYICEVRITENSNLIGERIGSVDIFKQQEVIPVGLMRKSEQMAKPSPWRKLAEGDILILKADPAQLQSILNGHGLELVADNHAFSLESLQSDNVKIVEAIVTRDTPIAGRSPQYLYNRSAGNINLLALAREGRTIASRLQSARFQIGDVLLLQGEPRTLDETISNLNLLPLAERDILLGQPNRIKESVLVFGSALLIAAFGLVSVPIAFIMAICAFIILDILPSRDLYKDIDWPVVIFLGAMLALGQGLETTGGATLIAEGLVALADGWSPVSLLILVMVVTMTLSDVINNAATALIMAPISVRIAELLQVSVDPFLMAVAVGASCAFLTPIGHQSNTLVMGPGGYHFGDYWRMGLPLEILIVITSIPVLLAVWPL